MDLRAVRRLQIASDLQGSTAARARLVLHRFESGMLAGDEILPPALR